MEEIKPKETIPKHALLEKIFQMKGYLSSPHPQLSPTIIEEGANRDGPDLAFLRRIFLLADPDKIPVENSFLSILLGLGLG